jgi:hypothetical protein
VLGRARRAPLLRGARRRYLVGRDRNLVLHERKSEALGVASASAFWGVVCFYEICVGQFSHLDI